MSFLEIIPEVIPDTSFALIEAYKADSSDKKVDLCPGFYRDENAKPWILPSVTKVIYFTSISPESLMLLSCFPRGKFLPRNRKTL